MTTLRKQLKDPIFAAWMAKTPRRDTNHHYNNWRVFVRRKKKGPWARADFHTYQEAYDWLMPRLEKFYDAAISSKAFTFRPPVVKDHGRTRLYFPGEGWGDKSPLNGVGAWWCPFCRRISRFRFFKRHHNVKPWYIRGERMCEICGAEQKWTRPTEWKW